MEWPGRVGVVLTFVLAPNEVVVLIQAMILVSSFGEVVRGG